MAVNFTLVTIAGCNVHNRRNSSTELRAESTSINVGICNDIGIEYREESDRVECIVYNHTIEQHLILNGRSTAHEDLTALVACAYKPWKGCQRLR